MNKTLQNYNLDIVIFQGVNDECEMNHKGSMAENKECSLKVRARTLSLTGSATSSSHITSLRLFPQLQHESSGVIMSKVSLRYNI